MTRLLWWLLLAVILGAWYFTIGIRVGMFPDIPMKVWNANGTNIYSVRSLGDKSKIEMHLTGLLQHGRVQVLVTDPNSTPVFEGQFREERPTEIFETINATRMGFYRVRITFEEATGDVGVYWSGFTPFQ